MEKQKKTKKKQKKNKKKKEHTRANRVCAAKDWFPLSVQSNSERES